MSTFNFIDLVKGVKPKVAIMTHLGLKMLASNPLTEAKKVNKETGVKTVAAFDGMSLNINYNNPRKFKMISLKDVNSNAHSCNKTLFKNERKNTFQGVIDNREFDELKIGKK